MLQLRMLSMPDSKQRLLAQAFSSAEKAAEHLANHILSSPELEGWRLIEPRFANLLATNSAIARWRKLATQNPPPPQLQQVYDVYCDCVDTEMGDARHLGWYKTDFPGGPTAKMLSAPTRPRTPVCVALGTSGVLAVFEREATSWVLRTAFIAGLGDPLAVRARRQSHGPGTVWGRPKANGMFAQRHKSSPVQKRDEMIRQRRRQVWNTEQRIYYEVFRPALQFIFQQYLTGIGPDGQPWRRDYALLKEVLPPRKRVSFATWQEYRRRCRLGASLQS